MKKIYYKDKKNGWKPLCFQKPVKNMKITSKFGYRIDPFTKQNEFHNGIDIGCPEGTAVYPIAEGWVHNVGYDDRNGFFIRILHQCDWISAYAHLKEMPHFKIGEYVEANKKIALSGNTGRSTAPHLHLTIWLSEKRNVCIDPEEVIDE